MQARSSERYSNVYGQLLQPPVKIEYVCTNSGTHVTKPPTSPRARVRAQVVPIMQRDMREHPSMNRSTCVKELLDNNIYKCSRNCWNVFQACSGDAHALARHPREGGPLRGFQGSQGDPGISPWSPKRPNQATEMGRNVVWTY